MKKTDWAQMEIFSDGVKFKDAAKFEEFFWIVARLSFTRMTYLFATIIQKTAVISTSFLLWFPHLLNKTV